MIIKNIIKKLMILSVGLLICYFLLQTKLFVDKVDNLSDKKLQIECRQPGPNNVESDAKVIKTLLSRLLENQIVQSNFIERYITNRTIDKVSNQAAEYYAKFTGITGDSKHTVKFASEIIDQTAVYVEVAIMCLEDISKELDLEYKKLTAKDRVESKEDCAKIKELESQRKEVKRVLNTASRAGMLMRMTDWIINSNSPIAWILRKAVGWQNYS